MSTVTYEASDYKHKDLYGAEGIGNFGDRCWRSLEANAGQCCRQGVGAHVGGVVGRGGQCGRLVGRGSWAAPSFSAVGLLCCSFFVFSFIYTTNTTCTKFLPKIIGIQLNTLDT